MFFAYSTRSRTVPAGGKRAKNQNFAEATVVDKSDIYEYRTYGLGCWLSIVERLTADSRPSD